MNPQAAAAAGSKVTSPPPTPSLQQGQAWSSHFLDPIHTSNIPLSALETELTDPGHPALCVCQVMSG